ncbi:hypothetical protein CGCSCA4_v012309 [Colletotrichum siamense]|uniref:Uncharacterized protein n=1 Tax=Colletotrichum siamense TaxID=690259 RepID=A0A9P5BUP5_COLSI|nr:hypothetical protein CGCSCA4_v012309 [Colletotrichum siamense]KAF4850701.1 hypothetical protein CGCSCA2_v011400 [Colletotrichum siamense]
MSQSNNHTSHGQSLSNVTGPNADHAQTTEGHEPKTQTDTQSSDWKKRSQSSQDVAGPNDDGIQTTEGGHKRMKVDNEESRHQLEVDHQVNNSATHSQSLNNTQSVPSPYPFNRVGT